MLNTKQFVQLQKDPAKESPITLQNPKQKLPTNVDTKLYRTRLLLGKFYCKSNVHKLLIDHTAEELLWNTRVTFEL